MKRLFVVADVILAILRNRLLQVILPIVAVLVLSGNVLSGDVVPRIMPLGDSITKGWYGSVYQWGYREPLYVSLVNAGYDFDFVGSVIDGDFEDPDHEGHNGWRADEILSGRLSDPNAGKLVDWLDEHQPDVILLHIGTNDVTYGNEDVNEVNSILNVIDSYETENNKEVTVILALIINRRVDSTSSKRARTTQFNHDVNNMATNRIANGDDIIIVDMESVLDYNIGADMADEVHPNDNGYSKMADVWDDALLDYFSMNMVSISGYVLEPDGNTPVEGVLIQADDNGISTTTDVNGHYRLQVDYGWSSDITAQKDGYIFEPNHFSYTDVNQDYTNMNYTATLRTFKIEGFVLGQDSVTPISDVNVSADNGGGPWTSRYGGGSMLTDENGYYEVWVDYNWSGNVTPRKYAYAFEPNAIHYEDVNQDYIADQDYTGNELGLRIFGYIRDECNTPVEGVLVDANNGGNETITDSSGFYEVWVDPSWSGTVTPTKLHYTFNPNWISYVDVLADQPDQDYGAENIYDLNHDCFVDSGDFEVMTTNWLKSDSGLPGDFDADGDVDFADFSEFGDAWKIE